METNHAWITRQLERISKNYPKYQPHTFEADEGFLYLGKPYALAFSEDYSEPCIAGNYLMSSHGEANDLKIRITDWYKRMAIDHFRAQVHASASQMGVTVDEPILTNAKMKWGSCSRTGKIRLNWRLIMSPPAVIDYVIVHELAHVRHHNHSPDFWSHVESFFPDYKIHRKWLRYNGHLLSLD